MKAMKKNSGILCVAILLHLGHAAAASAPPLAGEAFYFPRKETCTVMLDFKKSSDALAKLQGDAKSVEIARSLLAEWQSNARAKCDGAAKATLLAVIIPGKDVYGRPDFSNRRNLMRLDGDAEKLVELAKTGESLSLARLKSSAKVEVYP
jgi:hypothetical protein